MKKINRRKFLIDSATLIAMVQTAGLIEGCQPTALEKDKLEKGLQIIDENGLNLTLYFINLEFSGSHIVPGTSGPDCYIIAQLPPQSLHEQYYKQPNGPKDYPAQQLDAKLSIPAFLSFKLWPDQPKKKKLKFSADNLLNWNDSSVFKLITTGDFLTNQFPSFGNPTNINNVVFLEPKGGDIFDLNYYTGLVNKIIKTPAGTPNYLSIVSLPAGLILAPHTWAGVDLQLTQNTYAIAHQIHEHELSGIKIKRTVRERWNTQIKATQQDSAQPKIKISIPPALRALAIFTNTTYKPKTRSALCAILALVSQETDDYLPSLLDEAELIYLNQMTNSGEEFNIKVNPNSPFLLGATGATVQFTYNNYEIPQTSAYASISLVGYEHHFQDGRDNYIKVARIGVIAPTAQKALHVKIAERSIISGVSFMLYYEYVEILEHSKDFPPVVKDSVGTDFRTVDNILHYSNKININNVVAGFAKSPHIFSKGDDTINHFWLYKEFSKVVPPNVWPDNKDLLYLPFNYIDRNGNTIGAPSMQAVHFLRRDFFCDDAEINKMLLGDSTANPPVPPLMADYDDGQRLRIPFNNQVVAFTPDDPGQVTVANKVNQMKTEFIDYVFSVAKAVSGGAPNVFDTAVYPIFPQLTRAKVFVDHIQQYSPDKLPSLIEYHKDYLDHFYEVVDSNGGKIANQAKLIVQHTEDFINGTIMNIHGKVALAGQEYQQLNTSYDRIKNLFNAAADKTGAMINSSIEIERFSLTKQAMTLPKNVNTQWQNFTQGAQRVLHTLDIFNGSSPQILNGIDLKMILQDVLGIDSTPKFDLNKIAGGIGNIDDYINVLSGNSIVQKTLAQIKAVNTQVQSLESDVISFQTTFNNAQQQLVDAQNSLINSVPDVNKLREYCKSFYQAQRLLLFSQAQAVQDNVNALIKNDVILAINSANALQNYIANLFAQSYTPVIKTVRDKFATGDKLLYAQLDRMMTFIDDLEDDYNALLDHELSDIYAGAAIIQTDIALADYYGATGLNTLQDQLMALTATYLVNPIQDNLTKVNSCQTAFNTAQKKINDSIYGGIKDFMACYQILLVNLPDYSTQLQSINFFLNIYIKTNIGYYVDQFNKFKASYQDIANTIKDFETLLTLANTIAIDVATTRTGNLQTYINDLITHDSAPNLVKTQTDWKKLQDVDNKLIGSVNALLSTPSGQSILETIGANGLVTTVNKAQTDFISARDNLSKKVQDYESKLQYQAEGIIDQLTTTFNDSLNSLPTDQVVEASQEFEQALKILKTPIQQQINYQWQTQNFKSADLGIIRFTPGSSPVTSLNLNVTGKISFDPSKYPQVAAKVETYSENTLTNFGITFFSVITIDFASLSFVAGTAVSKNLSVKVRGVQFDGALSFIQMLEDMLGDLGDGFGMAIQPDGVTIFYNSPVISISSPGFTFSNIFVSVSLNIYFTQDPVLLTFGLSSPDCKATIAAGIYGGCFYCAVSIDTVRGMREIEMAIEMGAYLGISLGPISGSVKFMVGLYFRKDDTGVTMEGYFIAEGILSIWILSVSARLLMYVKSQNSQVTGGCTVSYSVKLGFIKKSFSGSYSKTIAGAESNHSQNQQQDHGQFQAAIAEHRNATLSKVTIETNQPDTKIADNQATVTQQTVQIPDDLEDLIYAIFDATDKRSMDNREWSQFYNAFYA